MVASNERGRAFEYCVRQELFRLAENEKISVEFTPETLKRDKVEKKYLNERKASDKKDFLSGAKAFSGWVKRQGWLNNIKKLVIERVSDDKAKKNIEMADLRLHLLTKEGNPSIKNISIKHHHNALCHPRLASLAKQAGIFDKNLDSAYRESYCKVWGNFYKKVKKLKKMPANYKELDSLNKNYKFDWLYEPLQRNAILFLETQAVKPENAGAFFRYLTGCNNYCVVKNEKNYIEIKRFDSIEQPTSFKLTYPYNSRTTMLIEFNNKWKIAYRIHTASSRIEENGKINKEEKEDPICINLEEVIKVEKVTKA